MLGGYGMRDLPDMLKQGSRARLFPVLADTSREGRVASIFLSLLPKVPALAEVVFDSIGIRIGKRTSIECYTEVVLNDTSDIKNRPDGFIVIRNGKTTWTALVEAKIGKSEIEYDQVNRYIDAAKSNNIDAVVTISNQFVATAKISPLNFPKNILKKASLFHWSWAWIQTQCEILSHQGGVDDHEQVFLIKEFQRLLDHPTTGIERFTQMGAKWKDIAQAVSNQEVLKKTSPEVEQVVSDWYQELRDMSLLLSSHVGQTVSVKIEKSLVNDAVARLRDGCRVLADEHKLVGTFVVPAAASEIGVCADLTRRSIVFSMRLKAPQDRKSTKARVNWLLKMLKAEDPRLAIRAHWPGKKPPTQKDVSLLREDPDAINDNTSDAAPHSFEVLLIEVDAKRFVGRRTFIETLEACSSDFYDLVGQHLRAWQAPPPKPVRVATPLMDEIDQLIDGSGIALDQTDV
jgi:hypothetical protein